MFTPFAKLVCCRKGQSWLFAFCCCSRARRRIIFAFENGRSVLFVGEEWSGSSQGGEYSSGMRKKSGAKAPSFCVIYGPETAKWSFQLWKRGSAAKWSFGRMGGWERVLWKDITALSTTSILRRRKVEDRPGCERISAGDALWYPRKREDSDRCFQSHLLVDCNIDFRGPGSDAFCPFGWIEGCVPGRSKGPFPFFRALYFHITCLVITAVLWAKFQISSGLGSCAVGSITWSIRSCMSWVVQLPCHPCSSGLRGYCSEGNRLSHPPLAWCRLGVWWVIRVPREAASQTWEQTIPGQCRVSSSRVVL